MSTNHTSPEDAADAHLRLRARASLAAHWGTFPLTDEPPDEPPRRLAAALRRRGVAADAFRALPHGGVWRPPAAADADAAAATTAEGAAAGAGAGASPAGPAADSDR
jgi:L-ascorbate metabolism protein UlaG (beta-lactamase superfamily)